MACRLVPPEDKKMKINSFDADITGPPCWNFLHSLPYLCKHIKTKESLPDLLKHIGLNITCPSCLAHFGEFMVKNKASLVTTAPQLQKWFNDLHNEIDKTNGKKEWSLEENKSWYSSRVEANWKQWMLGYLYYTLCYVPDAKHLESQVDLVKSLLVLLPRCDLSRLLVKFEFKEESPLAIAKRLYETVEKPLELKYTGSISEVPTLESRIAMIKRVCIYVRESTKSVVPCSMVSRSMTRKS